MSQLGFAPIVMAAASAAKSGLIAEGLSRLKAGIGGIFGDTAEDKKRKARGEALGVAALNGSHAAVGQLLYDMFEPRGKIIGDDRMPHDNKMSPEVVRKIAKAALGTYLSAYGGLPPEFASYAARIGLGVQTSSGMIQSVPTASFTPGVMGGMPTDGSGATLPPWVLPAAAAGLALVVFSQTSRRRRR